MKPKSSLIILILLLLFNSCSTRPHTELSNYKRLPEKDLNLFRFRLEQLLNQPRFQPSHFGIYIMEPTTETVLYSRNAHDLFMPASNMKLITTAAALSILGKDYRFKTEFYRDGKIENGVLKGNLYIKGSGDPGISGRYYDGDIDYIFNSWADTLRACGINKIDGDIIGDDSYFSDPDLGYGWEHNDLSYYYAAKTGALSYNDNCVDLHFIPGDTIGSQAKIIQKPIPGYMTIYNELTTVHPDSQKSIDFIRIPNTDSVRVKGAIPIDSDTTVDWVTVNEPTDFFLSGFENVLKEANITFNRIYDFDDLQNNNYDKRPPYDSLDIIFKHNSVKLDTIVYDLNKVSQNFFAENLQKTMGAEIRDKGTNKVGIEVEEDWFESIGIDPSSIFIRDGSGLSRHNLVTPFQIATILRTMKYSKNYQSYKKSLPIGGIDGTLKYRLEGSNAQGHVFAKTGYVGHVRALSGYVEAKNGREYIFSILANHYPTPTSCINNLQDKIVTLLYNLDY